MKITTYQYQMINGSPQRIHVLTFLLLTFIISTCDQSDQVFVTRIIKNASDYNIILDVYQSGSIIDNKSILKLEADTLKAKCATDHTGTVVGSTCNSGTYWGDADSVVVIFDNARFIRYCRDFVSDESCNANGKNIMIFPLHGGYEVVKRNYFLFEITNEDYDVAELLD